MTTINVSTEAELDSAIAEANAAPSGNFEIDLLADITETYNLVNAANLNSGVTLSVDDEGHTLVGPYALAGAVTIAEGSTLTALGIVPSDETIAFAGTGATDTVLSIGTSSGFAGVILGFASGDIIAVSTAITQATPGIYNSTTNTTSLSLTNSGTPVATLALEGDYSAASFSVSGEDISVTLPSVLTALSGGKILTGTQEVAPGETVTQTGQISFGSGSDPATVINQGIYDITGAYGISQGATESLFINDGTMERDPNGIGGVSYVDVDVIDTGTLIVPNDSTNGQTNLRFDGANNSFSGIFIGGGMVDYWDPSDPGVGVNALGNLDMEDGACTTVFGTVDQNGVVTVSSTTTIGINPGGIWNFTSDNGLMPAAAGPTVEITAYGTLAKTGGNGTTVVGVDVNHTGNINVAIGTLAFNGSSAGPAGGSRFSSSVTGAGVFSLGGGGSDQIESGATISTAGWTFTDANTNVTLQEALSYAGAFTDESGATLTLANDVTLTLTNFFGSGGSINFDSDAKLKFGGQSPSLFAAMVDGFAPGNVIDLTSIADVAGSHADMNYATNVLTITEGSNNYTLDFNPTQNFVGDYFHLATDGAGMNITENTTPCYCRGTLIRTERGEVPVEALTIGE